MSDDSSSGSSESMDQTEQLTYEQHLERIQLCREAEDSVGARKARFAMLKDYPLTEQMWTEWLDEEENRTDFSDGQSIMNLYELFNHAHTDYKIPSVFLRHINFIKKCWENQAAEEHDVEQGFEVAIEAIGLNIREGKTIWDEYLAFERDLVSIYSSEEAPKAETIQQKMDKVAEIYSRMMKIPFGDMTFLVEQYESDSKTSKVENIETIAQETTVTYAKLEPYERQLDGLRADSSAEEIFSAWKSYISYSQENMDDDFTFTLFERAILKYPMNKDIWALYLDYAEEDDDEGDCLEIYAKAVRNYPWSGDLWARYLRAMERLQQSTEEITDVYKKASNAPFSSSYDLVQVHLAYIDYFRRSLCDPSSGDYIQEAKDLIRGVFAVAAESVEQKFSSDVVSVTQFYKKWGDYEVHVFSDLNAAAAIWDHALEAAPYSSDLWINYAQHIRLLGDAEKTREILQRAFQSELDVPHTLGAYWVDFERESGNLEQWTQASKATQEAYAKYAQRQQDYISKYNQVAVKATASTKPKKLNEKVPAGKSAPKAGVKASSDSQKRDAPKRAMDTKEFAVPLPKKRKESETPEPAAEKSEQQPTMGDGVAKPKKSEYSDKSTVFVRHIDFSATKQNLEELFSQFGPIKELRLICGHKGTHKGFAYIEYNTQEEAEAAVSLHGYNLKGRKLEVALSDPKKNEEEKSRKQAEKAGQANKPASTGSQDKQKPRTFMVPSSVVKAKKINLTPTGAPDQGASSAQKADSDAMETKKTPLSNKDFRDLLFKS